MAKKIEKGKIPCPHCDEGPHTQGDRFCFITGKPLQQEARELEESKRENEKLILENNTLEKKSKRRQVINTILSLLLVVAVAGIIFFIPKPKEQAANSGIDTSILKSKINELENKLGTEEKKNKELDSQIKKLNNQIKILQQGDDQIEALTKRIIAAENESKGFKEKWQNEKERGQKLVKEKEDLEEKITKKEDEIKVLNNDILRLDENIAEKEKDLEDIKGQLREGKRKKNEIRKNCYNAYLILAQTYYKHREWNKALKATQKALELEKTGEATQLLKKIKKTKQEIGDVQVVNFLNLPGKIKDKYITEMEKVDMLILPAAIDVKGELNLILSVTTDGKILIQEFIDDYIIVSPGSQINVVKEKISERIEGISLSSPKGKANNPVRVEYWGVRFKLKTLRGEMYFTLIKCKLGESND